MIPGLWIEPEVAGVRSQLAQQPDTWFLMRHGKRALKNSRYLLDFRNPDVIGIPERGNGRLVHDYGVGYMKMDYNVDSLQGTDQNADSSDKACWSTTARMLAWLEGLLKRYPDAGDRELRQRRRAHGLRDARRLQIQSMTDQEDYLKLPAILVGASAAVLPEQLAIWSYPLAKADADQASFNMVTAMMCRIHQSGRLDEISADALLQVNNGIGILQEDDPRRIFLMPFRSILWGCRI